MFSITVITSNCAKHKVAIMVIFVTMLIQYSSIYLGVDAMYLAVKMVNAGEKSDVMVEVGGVQSADCTTIITT